MRLFITFLVAIVCVTNSTGQTLTLENAVQTALKNSLDIQLAANNVAINKNNNYIGLAGALPLIQASGSDVQSQSNIHQELNSGTVIEKTGANVNTAAASLSAGMLLYNGSRVWATKKRLEQLEQQSLAQLNSQIQNVIAAVSTAYYDVVRQQNYIKTINQSIDVARQRLDIVETQQKVGLANNADLFQSQIDLNTLLQSQQSQQLTIAQAKAELARLLTVNATTDFQVSDTILTDSSITLGDILKSVPENADLLAAENQISINEQLVREIAAQRYPTLSASTGYNFNRTRSEAGQLLLNQNNGPYVGVTLGIPIYNGSVFSRQQKAATYGVANARLQRDMLLRDYNAAVVKTYQAYATSMRQIATQTQNLKIAQDLLNLVMQRFRLRQATILEVRQAQESFENVSYSLTNFNFAAKAAEIELKRLSNRLGRSGS